MNFLKHIRTSNVVKAFLKTFFILFWTQFFGFGLKSQKFFLKAFFNMVKTFPKKKTWFSDFFLRKRRKYIFWRKTQCGKNSFFFENEFFKTHYFRILQENEKTLCFECLFFRKWRFLKNERIFFFFWKKTLKIKTFFFFGKIFILKEIFS